MKNKNKQKEKLPRIFGGTLPSPIAKFRKEWNNKGYELVNITQLCEFKLGKSGWCNDINEPNEEIYHLQVYYRDEIIANISDSIYIIDEDKYCYFFTEKWCEKDSKDFIIFRKVKNK